MKDENSDLLANCHEILDRWKNYFAQLLNVHRVNDVRQMEVHTAEPLLPELVILWLKLLLKFRRGVNRRIVMRFRHN